MIFNQLALNARQRAFEKQPRALFVNTNRTSHQTNDTHQSTHHTPPAKDASNVIDLHVAIRARDTAATLDGDTLGAPTQPKGMLCGEFAIASHINKLSVWWCAAYHVPSMCIDFGLATPPSISHQLNTFHTLLAKYFSPE